MGDDDLFRMLGIDPGAGGDGPPGDDPFGDAGAAGAGPRRAFDNPHALEMDRWGERRGRDLLATRQTLADAGVDEYAAADFHAAAFDTRPVLLPGCSDPLRHRFLADLLENPAYRDLHATTALDEHASALAAETFCEAWAAFRREQGAGEPPETPQGDMAVFQAAGAAAKAAAEGVGVYAACGAGCGVGRGEPGSFDPARAAAVYRRVRGNRRLARIMDEAGKFRRLARSKQRVKTVHGQGEVVDVTLGAELERLLPLELARLTLPETELDTYRRLVQRQAQVRELRDHEPRGRGPIVVIVDESGSMRDDGKIETAKGLALAMAWVARQQKRWCCLCSFGAGPDTVVCALPPHRWDEAALLDWLSHFFGGGTTLDAPLGTIPLREWPGLVARGLVRGKTDMLLITDGQVPAPDELVNPFNAWKAAERVRCVTVLVGAGRAPGPLAKFSDEFHAVATLGPDSAAVGRVLSV